MTASTGAASGGVRDRDVPTGSLTRDHTRRRSTETKSSYKTTELMAYVAMLIAIFVAGAVTSGGTNSSGVHHADAFPAHQVWLYATILTIGYLVSRGLAKMGSRDPYDADRH